MKRFSLVTILGVCFLLTGCNPFGKNSIINLIDDTFEGGPTTSEINSGGKTELTTPASGLSADAHSISFSVGNPFRQTNFSTANGHTVTVSIIGSKRE